MLTGNLFDRSGKEEQSIALTEGDWWINYVTADTGFAGGTGTASDPYLIETAEQLAYLSYMIYSGKGPVIIAGIYDHHFYYSGKYFRQIADIDLSGHYWQPIGIQYYRDGTSIDHRYFSGNYDGDGFTISGIYTPAGTTNAYSYQGLFGCVYERSYTGPVTISNVVVTDSVIQGSSCVGGIVGHTDGNYIITNCYNTGSVTGSGSYVGGIVGYGSYYSTITNCYNTGSVTGSSSVGGIAGYVESYSNITNCYNTGGVTGSGNRVGGIVGGADFDSTITNCYNTGNVTGSGDYVGGICGSGSPRNCYNTGSVTGDSRVAGICGDGSPTNSFNLGEVNGRGSFVGGITADGTATNCYYGGECGNIGSENGADTTGAVYSTTLTTDAKTESWYQEVMPSWNFVLVWGLSSGLNNGYPYLFKLEEKDWWLARPEYYDTTWEGSGTEDEPYLISSAADLARLSYMVYSGRAPVTSTYYYYSGVYFKQTADIDLSEHYWQPIGIYYDRFGITLSRYFAGNYDGDNYTISGVKTPAGYDSAYSYQGLFGYVYGRSRATIKNVGVIDSDIRGYSYVGGIAGYINTATISNCYSIGSVTGSDYVGGVVGFASSTSISNCYKAGDVNGINYVGGVVGSGDPDNSFNVGSVNGTGSNIGGVSGSGGGSNCYYGGECGNIGGVNGADTTGAVYSATLTTDAKTESWYQDVLPSWDFMFIWGLSSEINEGYPHLLKLEEINWWLARPEYYDTIFEGSGTEEAPYLISTAAELAGLSYLVYSGTTDPQYSQYISGDYYFTGAYFKQTANIDLSAHYWQPIGIRYDRKGTSTYRFFSGYYDGAGYTISGVKTPAGDDSAYSYQGLFGYVRGQSSTNKAEIKNVGVINSNIQGYQYVGGIVGDGYYYLTITNCYNTASVTGLDDHVGGIVGDALYSSITNCYNTGSVTGSYYVGGVVGYAYPSTITNCYNTGTVTGSGSYVGGIVGNGSNTTIANCYYGGNCDQNLGGINGADATGASYLEDLAEQAKTEDWYNSTMPWDFVNIWQLDPNQNQGYPIFKDGELISGYWIDDNIRGNSFDGGSGTQDDPYKISTAKQLAYLSYMVYSGEAPVTGSYYYYAGVYFVQTADIDLSGYYWQPIGIFNDRNGTQTQHYFSGNYDGGGFTISGMFTPAGNSNAYSYQGLFGYVSEQNSTNLIQISNIGIVDSFVQGYQHVGGVVGYIRYGEVTKSYNTSTIVAMNSHSGGIVGGNNSTYTTSVIDCYNTGNVFGTNNYTGGIIGRGAVSGSYNLGNVNGVDYVGGITGDGSVKRSFNLGEVKGTGTYVGGIAGSGSTFSNCYYGGNCLESIGGVQGSNPSGVAYSQSLVEDAKTKEWLTSELTLDMFFVWKLDSQLNDGFPVFITDPSERDWWLASSDFYNFNWAGAGTKDDPYKISTAEELAGLSYKLYSKTGISSDGLYFYSGKYFELTNDVDLSAHAWEPIGNEKAYFAGVFDGSGFTITGLTSSSSYDLFALFGHVVGYENERAEIKNINLKDSVINAGTGGAGFIILGENILISKCNSEISINVTGNSQTLGLGVVSGIALSVYNGVIENCENRSILNKNQGAIFIGGIVSFASKTEIKSCKNYSDIISGYYCAGITAGPISITSSFFDTYFMRDEALLSDYNLGASIADCVNYGELSGSAVSGIVFIGGEVLRCENYGDMSGQINAGILGMNTNPITRSGYFAVNVRDCVNYGNINGSNSAGIANTLEILDSSFVFDNCVNFGKITGTSSNVAGIVCEIQTGSDLLLSNLVNYGDISGSNSYFSGIISSISGEGIVTLENCVNYAEISGQSNIGGLIGRSSSSNLTLKLTNCVNAGDVFGTGDYIGGIIGSIAGVVEFANVYSFGNVSGSNYVGGFIGNSTATNISINSSLFEGNITATATTTDVYVGGFIGYGNGCSNFSVTGSYVNSKISVSVSSAYASGIVGEIVMSTTTDPLVIDKCAVVDPLVIDKCAVVTDITSSTGEELTNSRAFYFSSNLVDTETILNSYAIFNDSLTLSDTTDGMDGNFAYLENFQGGKPVPIGIYYILDYGITTGIVDQINSLT